QKYKDRVIFQKQTPYQRIVVTQWKDYYWLYLNGNEQFSSFDEERYHEPLVHPAMKLSVSREKILVLGGGDGLAAREILKYPEVKQVTLVDIDPAMTDLAQQNPLFVKINKNAMNDRRVNVLNQDAYIFLRNANSFYDVIIVDLPDPKTVEIARLYTRQFYSTARRHLSKGGVLVTQATSPFFSRKAFLSILKSVDSAGFAAIAYHNQIPTLGEWGWVLGVNVPGLTTDQLKDALENLDFSDIPTRFLNTDAMISMVHFGKNTFADLPNIKVNDELDLKLFQYYRNGTWDLY
ncbi:MAG TPA: spermidine synthase, partial [Caldithrix sp.]|nr:spermidine synthase [Caldithrix sp.]